jgi:hypothetical protein
MTAGFSEVAPVRKELRSVGPCTPTHIFDGFVRNAGVAELESNERSEVTVRLRAFPPNDRSAVRGVFHFASNLLTDFERIDADVRTDRHDELGRVVCKGVDRARYDPGNRATPSGVRRANVPARWMRDQHRHAIGCSRGNAHAFDARDQRIAFFIGNRFRELDVRDHAHPSPVHLPLLEQTVDAKPEALGEAGSVLANRDLVVTQMEAQVEAVVRCGAHPAQARGKRVVESALIQKGGM